MHVSDLTNYYELIVSKILKKETIPSGETGYYFPVAHDIDWWETLDQLAIALHARGLVRDSRTEVVSGILGRIDSSPFNIQCFLAWWDTQLLRNLKVGNY